MPRVVRNGDASSARLHLEKRGQKWPRTGNVDGGNPPCFQDDGYWRMTLVRKNDLFTRDGSSFVLREENKESGSEQKKTKGRSLKNVKGRWYSEV
jgi:hypothetical protein